MTTSLLRAFALATALWFLGPGIGSARAAGPATADAPPSDGRILVLLHLPPQHFRPGADYGDGYADPAGQAARRRIAQRLARRNGLVLVTDWPLPAIGLDCFVMAAPARQSPAEAAARLAQDPDVAWAEPMHAYRAQNASDAADPLYPAQPAARVWRLRDLHQISTGRGVRVAVVDSLVDGSNPDLKGQVAVIRDFAPEHPAQGAERHGTAVAGVIAARAGNGVGIVGVAPRARLMALRGCWQLPETATPGGTVCDSLSLARALHFAITHEAQVVNLSLSGPSDRLLSTLIDEALGRGEIVVAAFDRQRPDGGFPASHPGVIPVAEDSRPAPRAGVYLAPGRDVPATEPGGRWSLVQGDSFAAAHVSGLMALIRQGGGRPRPGPILISAAPSGGAIDACATLVRAFGPCDCACSRRLASSTAGAP